MVGVFLGMTLLVCHCCIAEHFYCHVDSIFTHMEVPLVTMLGSLSLLPNERYISMFVTFLQRIPIIGVGFPSISCIYTFCKIYSICEIKAMEEIRHTFIGSSSHYLQVFNRASGAGFYVIN